MPKLYRVWPLPNASNRAGEAHFVVRGPKVDVPAQQYKLASLMEHGANAGPHLTPFEREAVCNALAFVVLTGETEWSQKILDAMRRAHAKLS